MQPLLTSSVASGIRLFAVFILASAATFILGCSSAPQVKQMVEPQYPVVAQSNGIEGVVDVIIQVGVDGRVLSVSQGAEGSGTSRDLVVAAQENAKQLVWGPFPPKFTFPWYHSIRYVFSLQGKRTHFPLAHPIVITRFPDRIEIVAVPCDKTYLELKPSPPSAGGAGSEVEK
jgi:TonB family protein